MNVLALDTSSEACSAALWRGGPENLLSSRSELAPRGHTRLLMPMIRELLNESGLTPNHLDALAFACGPGSFTGLRIATGVAQGLAWGLDIPVVPVSSLQVVAAQALEQFNLAQGDRIAVAFDARMGEVYWACFECQNGRPESLADARVCPPGQIALPPGEGHWWGVGSGWRLRDQFPAEVVDRGQTVDDSLLPQASMVARLGVASLAETGGVSAVQAQPVYIRDEVAWKKLPGR